LRALADTSVFVALETGRPIGDGLPDELLVSVVTVAELRLGVLRAASLEHRTARLGTLRLVESLDALPVDDAVASAWSELVAVLREAGRRAPVNDTWIAATAIAHRMPLATQDADYEEMPGLEIVRL
jgi:predicted nucleic acid-binding protein